MEFILTGFVFFVDDVAKSKTFLPAEYVNSVLTK